MVRHGGTWCSIPNTIYQLLVVTTAKCLVADESPPPVHLDQFVHSRVDAIVMATIAVCFLFWVLVITVMKSGCKFLNN
jgi:hypothetical protein